MEPLQKNNMIKQNENCQVSDSRDTFFDKLYELAKKDKDLIFLTADMGAYSLEKFKRDLPDQYFNIGIAEQNTILVACGLALSGKKVFVYEITPFITDRCFEQIKIDIAYMKLPIVVVGIGTGFTYGVDGPTHYSIDDIALMATLENMTVFSTNDRALTESVCEMAYLNKKPTYIRLEKGLYKDIHTEKDFSSGCSILKEGDVTIFSTGKTVYDVLYAVGELEKEHKCTFGVVDVYRIQPINKEFISSIVERSSHVVVVEEHLKTGGLGYAINDILSKENFMHLHVKSDWNNFFYGNSEYMLKNSNLDKDGILNSLKKYVVR